MNLSNGLRGLCLGLVALLAACGGDNDRNGILDDQGPIGEDSGLIITGPDSIPSGSSQDYVVTATDSKGRAVIGAGVLVGSTLGTLTTGSASPTTDANGQVRFTLAAATTSPSGTVTPVEGTATVTARATIDNVAVTEKKTVAMTPNVFQFTSPEADSKVSINTVQPITLQWTSNGNPVSAEVTVEAKVGTLTDADGSNGATRRVVSTDAGGLARLNVVSSTVGAETITATAGAAFKAELDLTYVGTPAALAATAPTSIPANGGAATITATVTDASGGPVPGVTVLFELAAGAPAAGVLSPTRVVTNATGRANAVYTANNAPGNATVNVTSGSLPAKSVSFTITP